MRESHGILHVPKGRVKPLDWSTAVWRELFQFKSRREHSFGGGLACHRLPCCPQCPSTDISFTGLAKSHRERADTGSFAILHTT